MAYQLNAIVIVAPAIMITSTAPMMWKPKRSMRVSSSREPAPATADNVSGTEANTACPEPLFQVIAHDGGITAS
ncbi:hypothetical protein [Mycolicibacterium mageritense]|uniref:hypothetical protein n=1 Tax=Mycolicibacterium mageritense TaxID=53462 RepID=UPI002572A93A|nr:hypothetical protein [Mycolicibacterium mageritense]